MKKIFVVFKKQPQEVVNAYSLVDEATFLTIPSDIVQAKKELDVADDKLFTTQEYEALREELLK